MPRYQSKQGRTCYKQFKSITHELLITAGFPNFLGIYKPASSAFSPHSFISRCAKLMPWHSIHAGLFSWQIRNSSETAFCCSLHSPNPKTLKATLSFSYLHSTLCLGFLSRNPICNQLYCLGVSPDRAQDCNQVPMIFVATLDTKIDFSDFLALQSQQPPRSKQEASSTFEATQIKLGVLEHKNCTCVWGRLWPCLP